MALSSAHLEDLEQIKVLKARYCRLLDAKEWEEWAMCFTEDCDFSFPDPSGPEGMRSYRGRDQIRTLPTAVHGAKARTVHRVTSPEIELTGNRTARGTWAMFDLISSAGLVRHGFGYYHEEYVKERDQTWRISRLTLVR